MKKQILCFSFVILIILLISTTSAGQTIKERSNNLYFELSDSHGIHSIRILNELTLLRKHDSISRAKELALIAVKESIKLKHPSVIAYSYVVLADVLLLQNKPDSADYYLSLSASYYNKFADNSNNAVFLFTLANVEFYKKNYRESLDLHHKALLNGERIRDYVLLGSIYLRIADCYKELGQRKDILFNLSKSEHYFDLGKDPLVIGPQLIGVGIHYADIGLYDKANSQFIKAVKMCEISADSLFMGYLYINLSRIYAGHKLDDKAEEYYNKSMQIFRNIKNDRAIAYNMNLRGLGYISEKKYPEAIPLFTEAGLIMKNLCDWQAASFAYGNLSDLYLLTKNGSKAGESLRVAEQMCFKAGDRLSLAAFLLSKGKYLTYLKDYKNAYECFNNSLAIARFIAVQDIVEENLIAISDMYQAKGDVSEALRYYKIYTSVKDSVMQADANRTVAETLAKYETEKKDKQIKALLSSKLKTESSRYYIFGNIIAIILILFVLIIFFFRLKGKYSDRLQSLLAIKNQVYNRNENVLVSTINCSPDKASKPVLTAELQSEIWIQLQNIMRTDRLFLQSDLTLAELARKLNTNTTYLSKVINDISNQNFCNYLNAYRINEACRLFSDPQCRNFTIEAIAFSVGFKSKSAFNAAFRKIKSITPSEYLALQSVEIEQLD